MHESEILFTALLFPLHLLVAYYVIREKRSNANMSFAFAMVTASIANFFALLGFLAADNYLQLDFLIFWEIGVIFLTITPIGFIFSAKFIYFGENTFKRLDSQLWVVITIIFMILVILLYPIPRLEAENIMIWDTLAAIMILGAAFEYYRIYRMKPTWNNKVALIITGLITSALGIFSNFIIILVTNESSAIFRHLFVILGTFIVIIAYNFIPENQRKIKDWLELSILNKEMELIIDIITHDLTNQLVATQGYLNLHEKQDKPDYLVKSLKGINNAQNLVKNISIMMKSKIDSKDKLSKISLLEEIQKAIEELKTLFPKKTIEIKIRNNSINETHTVSADSLFSHLLINLLTNAVKSYNKEETKIMIELERKELSSQKFSLLIIDHGRGIDPKKRLEIFERYSQFRKDGTGSGLGLFIAHTLMLRYKGKIRILSTDPLDFTKGTTINLELSV